MEGMVPQAALTASACTGMVSVPAAAMGAL